MKLQILLALILVALLILQNRNSNFEDMDCEYCTKPDANKEFCKMYCPGVSLTPVPCTEKEVDCNYCAKPDANPECCKTVYCPTSPVGYGLVNGECVNLANVSEKVDMGMCATNNGIVMFDILGSVNQRNYPMVGKDQGALDSSSTLPPEVEQLNAVPVNVNMTGYQINGGEMTSTSVVAEDTLAVPEWVTERL